MGRRSRALFVSKALSSDEARASSVLSGRYASKRELPIRELRLIREWTGLHRAELQADWELAQARQPLASIDPLP